MFRNIMPPFYLISILFVVIILPNLVTNSNVVQTFNGQILPVPKITNFIVQVNCANCVAESNQTIATTNGKFQIVLKAKDGDKIGQIGVNIKSCSKLGRQIRSNTWTIEEPNSGEFYKFFIGHFSPDPKCRLFLRIRFDGKLPELAGPNAFYSVLLKKPNTDINQTDQKQIGQVNESDQNIFAQIFVNGKDAAARDEWTEDKGFMLGLNIAGIEYLRENEMPAMELQLIEVGRDDDADSVQDNSRQLRELERATLSEELTANSGSLSPFILFTRQKSKSLKSAADSKFNFERLNATKGNPPMAELNDQSTKSKLPFGSKWKYAAARIGHPNAQNYHKRRSGSAAVSDNDGIRLGNRRSINAEIETLGTNAQPNAFCNETKSRTPSFTKNIRTNTNLDDKEDENALRKRILNRMCCLMLPKLRKHKKRSGESNNSTAANSAEDITRAGGISPPNQELNAGESWHTDDIGIGTGTSNAHSPNEGNIYGIIDNKNNYNNNYDAGGDFGVQYQRQTMHGDWHEPAGASPIQSDGTEQNAVRRFSNASQKENVTKLAHPKSVRTRVSSKYRTKRAISPRKSVNEHHYSISRSSSSTKAELLLLSVLIKMPVFNRRETEEQDNFIYTFKLPPPNEIPAEEVNRQQLKVEPRPMPTARTTSRNNSGKAMSAATTGMTSNSSTYRNVGLDTKLDNSYEEQFQRTVAMPKKRKGKNSHSKNAKVNLQNAPFDPTETEKADNNQQNSDYGEFSKDEMEMAMKESINVNWQSMGTQKPIQIEGGKKEKVPEEVVGKGKKIVEEVKKEGNTKKPKSTKKVGETSNAQKESPKKEIHQNLEILKPTFVKEGTRKESPKTQKKVAKIRGQKHSDGEKKKGGQKSPDSAAEGNLSTDSFPSNNSFNYSNQNLQNLNSTSEKTINVDGAESPKKDKRFDGERGKSVLKSQNVFKKSLDSDGNLSTNSVPQKDSPDHWTEQSSNSKDSIQILESEQEVQNPYDAYDLNNDQNYEETDQSVASSELIEKDKESLHQNWDRIKPDRITKNSCQDSGKLPESTFLESEKLSEIEKKWMKTPPNEGKDGIIVAEHAEVVGGDFVDVQQQQLDKNFDPKEGQTIENAVQNEEELSQREDDQNNLKKVDGIRSHEQSSSSTPPNVAHGMASIDHPRSIGTEDDYTVNEADLKILEENLKDLHLSREELLEILMHPKKEQKKKLDLNLSAAELPYLKQYFEAGHFGSLKPPKEETKIVGISVILREWLDEKTEAFEGLTAEEIEKMKEILQRIYPNEGIESVFSYDDFEESDEKPLIRKPKGQTIAERLERQFSNAEKSQADEEATNSEFDDLCRNKFQLNRCENLYKMVEDDLEAIKSDAESRAHLGIELKKLCKKREKNNKNCQFSGTEDLDEFLQNLSADDLDWLRTELEMVEREKASDSKNKNKIKKSTKSMAFHSDSDIGIKTDSELLKKKQRQAHRLKPSRLGTKNIKDAAPLAVENNEVPKPKLNQTIHNKVPEPKLNQTIHNKVPEPKLNQTIHNKVPEPKLNQTIHNKVPKPKLNQTIHNKVMDQIHQSHEQNLPATYKKTEDGQKVASYLEWKKMTESSEEKRHDDGLDGPISDAEWEEATTHPNDAITAAIQDNATTIEQQRPGGFLNRQINRLSSALTGIMVTAEAEQEPEQQSYFEHLEHFLLDYDNWFHYHGLEECDDANNAQ